MGLLLVILGLVQGYVAYVGSAETSSLAGICVGKHHLQQCLNGLFSVGSKTRLKTALCKLGSILALSSATLRDALYVNRP
jgi:hypothetical protein